jgi:cytoskeletal protein RodZ
MTRLFNRNKNKTTITELEEYYANQNQRKTRTGAAWFMALLSLLITIAVIVVLFFAGRWIYRTITNNDTETPATTSDQSESSTQLPNYDGDINAGNNEGSGVASDTNNDTAGTSSSTDNSGGQSTGTVSNQAASTTESNADRIASTGPTTSEIPNTGSGDILLIVPIVAGLTGYAISLKRQNK